MTASISLQTCFAIIQGSEPFVKDFLSSLGLRAHTLFTFVLQPPGRLACGFQRRPLYYHCRFIVSTTILIFLRNILQLFSQPQQFVCKRIPLLYIVRFRPSDNLPSSRQSFQRVICLNLKGAAGLTSNAGLLPEWSVFPQLSLFTLW